MNLGFNFDPTQVAPNTGSGAQLPVSDEHGHPVVIIGDEIVPAKNGKGMMLVLEVKIYEGNHAGQTGKIRLNLQNESPDAVRIAYGDLSAIAHSCGVLQAFSDAAVLYNRPFRVLVRPQASEPRYTEIYGYRDINGNKPGQAPAAAPQAAPMQTHAPAFGQPQQQAPAPAFGGSPVPAVGAPAFGQSPAPFAAPNSVPAFTPSGTAPAAAPWGQR